MDTAPEYWAGGWCLAQSPTKKKKKKDSWTLPWQRLHCEYYRSLKFLKPVSEQWMISTATTTFQSATTPRQHSSHGRYAEKFAKFWSCGIAKQSGRRLNSWIRCCLLHSFGVKWSILIWSTAPCCQDDKVVTSLNVIIPSNSWKVKSNRFNSRVFFKLIVWLVAFGSVKCKSKLRICTSLWGCISLACEFSRLVG